MRQSIVLLIFSLLAIRCDDGGPNGPDNATTTTTTTAGNGAVMVLDVIEFGLFSVEGGGALVAVELRMQEAAGLGTNINYIRLDYLRATGELEERAEIGADDIVSELGTNRIGPSATWQEVVLFFFRASIKKGRQFIVTVNLTDDRGNTVGLVEAFIFN